MAHSFTCKIYLFVFTVLIGLSVQAAPENPPSPPQGEIDFEGYTILYSTFNSLFIPADIAKLHKLVRGKDQTLINISVQSKTLKKAVAAKVEATAKNLVQQSKIIKFKTIDEPGAIYYIGSLRHTNEEILHIDFNILPEGESTPLQFRITRKLYTEN